MRLFTVDLELGDKTLEALTRISSNSVLQVELGPQTRAMIERLWTPENAAGGVAGLVKKGAEALRSDS
jgi:regulator of RNase E activity RraA